MSTFTIDRQGYPTLKLFLLTALLASVCVIALGWRFLPLKEWINSHHFLTVTTSLRSSPLAPLCAIATYVGGGLVSFPVVILIPLTAFVFGPVPGLCYSLLGLLLNASLLYGIGHILGHRTVSQLAGKRIHHLSQRLARHGFLTIATLRILPLAPFTVINLMAGASHVRFQDYTAGTLIGILPALTVMTLVGNQLAKATAGPPLPHLAVIGVLMVITVGAGWWLKRWLTITNLSP